MAENPDPFEDERASRMKALQMVGYFIVTSIWGLGSIWLIWDFLKIKADLGTARREHISTVDRPNKLHRIDIQQIEATRDSNKEGTAAYMIAEANREKLNSWATFHETLEENHDAENLDPLLDGQTHRMGLEARVKEGALGAAGNANRGRMPTRGGLSSGRGGGAIGGHARRVADRSTVISTPPTGPMGRGGITKHDPRRLTPPNFRPATKASIAPLPKKLSDPSKDCNNPSDSHGRSERKRYNASKNLPPVTKARRPVFAAPPNVNFESLLADGDDFMAAIPGAQTPTAVKPAQPPVFPKEAPVMSGNMSAAPSAPQVRSILPVKPAPVVKEVPTQPAMPIAKPIAPAPSKPAAAPKPVTTLRIDVFTNPSENCDSQGADAVALKTDHGFGSYLPQPQRMMHSEDHDDDDLLLYISSEEPVAAFPEKKDKVQARQEDTGASLLDTSNEPEGPRRTAAQQTRFELNEMKPEEELSAVEQELLRITKLLSNQSVLDPDVVIYLQERKDHLEKELSVKQIPAVEKEPADGNTKATGQHTMPDVPQHTQLYPTPSQPVSTAPTVANPENLQQPAPSNASTNVSKVATGGPAIKIAGYTDAQTKVQPDDKTAALSQNFEDDLKSLEIKEVKAQDPKVKNGNNSNWDPVPETPATSISNTLPTNPSEPPLIIGDHLLPGRSVEPIWPYNIKSKPTKKYEPKENKYVPTPFMAANPFPATPTSCAPGPIFDSTWMQSYTQASTFNLTSAFNPSPPLSQPLTFTYPPAPGTTFAPVPTSFHTPAPVPAFAPAHKSGTTPIINTTDTAPTAPKSRFKMRDKPYIPESAATLQYSGKLAAERNKMPTTPIRDTNENISPATKFAAFQPIQPGQKNEIHSRNSSSSLSPAAPTFQPLASARDPNSFGFDPLNQGRNTTSQHSNFSSTAPVAPQEPKNLFVAEMAKHGVSVTGVPITTAAPEKKKYGVESSKYAH
ncbi:uncharacterized protein GIQ15_01425 [Arthroderma uncinatum]|uniref:uncharacterized protein n=1 Tax=Arthroderma uncinatum TaxID=74035 RepID=UPI00144AD754|nr:uncharacterized protein GIQ15_01425 [Arthroderma uncinatum]KAF3491908.1 hypothetical protein GIQ15_01425 [Arthroderma uncinatum]